MAFLFFIMSIIPTMITRGIYSKTHVEMSELITIFNFIALTPYIAEFLNHDNGTVLAKSLSENYQVLFIIYIISLLGYVVAKVVPIIEHFIFKTHIKNKIRKIDRILRNLKQEWELNIEG